MSDGAMKKPGDAARTYSVILWIGALELLMVAVVMMARSNMNFPSYDAIAIATAIGLITFGGNLFYFLGMKKPALDERTRKIGTTAMTYSWYVTFAVMCFLIMLYYASPFQLTLDAGQIFGTILFFMMASMLALTTYLNQKGDVS